MPTCRGLGTFISHRSLLATPDSHLLVTDVKSRTEIPRWPTYLRWPTRNKESTSHEVTQEDRAMAGRRNRQTWVAKSH